jgi:ABC-type iron transport system FetAB ATPase subunit
MFSMPGCNHNSNPAASKQITQNFDIETSNLKKKINEVVGKEQYRVVLANRFAALESLRSSYGY